MTDDEIGELIQAAILMTSFGIILMSEYTAKYITETGNEKNLADLIENIEARMELERKLPTGGDIK